MSYGRLKSQEIEFEKEIAGLINKANKNETEGGTKNFKRNLFSSKNDSRTSLWLN